MEINLPLDFKEFLKLLNERNVRYLLIRDTQLVIMVIHVPQGIWMFGSLFTLKMRKRWLSY
jgi:hypothetical protein